MSDPLPVPAVPTMPLLEVDRVASMLSFSPEFVRRLLRQGKLVGIQFGTRWRVDPREVQAFIARNRRPPVTDRRHAPRET